MISLSMTNKMIRLNKTNIMGLEQAIEKLENQKEWIIAGELNNILEKSKGKPKIHNLGEYREEDFTSRDEMVEQIEKDATSAIKG